jgi:hypothetical protein
VHSSIGRVKFLCLRAISPASPPFSLSLPLLPSLLFPPIPSPFPVFPLMASAGEPKQFFGTADARRRIFAHLHNKKSRLCHLGFMQENYGNCTSNMVIFKNYWKYLLASFEELERLEPNSIAPLHVDQVSYYLHSNITGQ